MIHHYQIIRNTKCFIIKYNKQWTLFSILSLRKLISFVDVIKLDKICVDIMAGKILSELFSSRGGGDGVKGVILASWKKNNNFITVGENMEQHPEIINRLWLNTEL